ncbi:hypothetical protein EKG37_20910 [Robertmurraya yapensis]|uniref:LTA synthase family protein n=2 Tax=Bacillaceae TaxID=186817 RepID=A0A3S0I6T5_9BACI|nr:MULTISPECIES: hypothetical protein [Bacillaceae]RTR26535.1 hypothetical protein EKG37_20910 [Bacillus yapensis]TKC15102.1 hypothetical protein FA727_19610 [Robertmurraya kyonggiensis]TKS93710.1 hypothetical protein FAR12_20915 [Bacillus yapensis]
MVKNLLKKYSFLFMATLFMWLKTYVIYKTSFDIKIENGMQAFILFLNPLSFLLLLFGLGLFMKERARNIYVISVGIVSTLVLIANVMFYKFFNDFLTIPVLFQSSNMGDLGSSIGELVNPLYLLLFIDVFLLIWWASKRNNDVQKATVKESWIYFVMVTAIFIINLGLAESERPQLLTRSFDREILVKNIGIFNFHIYDGVLQTRTSTKKALANSDELTEIQNYLMANKPKPNEKMFGIAEKRNVIFVSMESTQSFVVNERLNGEEITPFLNDFIGVPSGKCGFTTLNYFFGNKNLASPTLSRRSKVS